MPETPILMPDGPTGVASGSSRGGQQAIYRRFRAQTFSQMVGQDAVVQTLRNAVRLGRLGHAFLFVGPRGTGKTSMARILAKAANCTDLSDGEPCDTCPSCTAIREGRALDVIELDAASNNKVDDMRELLPRVFTAPADLRRKVFIIDEVQRIKEGWDVLLKTLEEPPEGVLFVFCTTDPSQIRPAVVSRLQRFTFRPLPHAVIEEKLRYILEVEGRMVEAPALALIARLAGGGMRDAESMLDQVLVSREDPVTAAGVAELLGLADDEAVDRFLAALLAGEVVVGISVLDRLEREGRDLVAFSEQLVSRLREELVRGLSTEGARDLGRIAALSGAARRLTGIDAARSVVGGQRWQLELCLLAAAEAAASLPVPSAGADVPVSLEAATSTSEAPASKATGSSRDVVEPAKGSRPASPRSVPPPSPPARSATAARDATPVEAAAAPAPPDAGDLLAEVRREWAAIVAAIGANPANRPLISTCRPVAIRDGVLVLGFPEDQAFLRDIAERKRGILEDGIRHVLGRAVAVRCVATNLELGEAVAEGPDLVAHARRIFEGELVGVEDIE